MVDTRVVHGFTGFRGLGGVERLLQLHWEKDADHQVESRFVIFFEPDDRQDSRVRGLGLKGWNTIAQARRRFAQAIPNETDVAVYQNFWGLPFFAELDRAQRRLGVLHSDWPGMRAQMRQLRGLLDGVLCVSRPPLEKVREELPELGTERTGLLPTPVAKDSKPADHRPLAGRPLVVGFSGRLSVDAKRVDRFPALAAALEGLGVKYQLEFLGEGPAASWLRRKFASKPHVVFHGRLSGQAYWEVLRRWDVIAFTSDYEGMPITLLEAFSAGVLPLFPVVGSEAENHVRRVSPELLYSAGELDSAARALQRLCAQSDDEVQGARRRAAEVAKPHLGDGYFSTQAAFMRHLLALPRISSTDLPKRGFVWSDHIPLGLLLRVAPRGFWRPNGGFLESADAASRARS